jgi:hypothetical protein
MTADEGARFLLNRSKIDHPNDGDFFVAKSIAEEFGGLPLGLEQAGHTSKRQGCLRASISSFTVAKERSCAPGAAHSWITTL